MGMVTADRNKEDHYHEEGKPTSDEESKDKENSGSDDGTSTVRDFTKSLAEYIVKKDTEELV